MQTVVVYAGVAGLGQDGLLEPKAGGPAEREGPGPTAKARIMGQSASSPVADWEMLHHGCVSRG